jgi:hypothetical protein
MPEKVKSGVAKGNYCKENFNECLTVEMDEKSEE